MSKPKDQNPSVDEESQNTTFDEEEDVKTVQCTEEVSSASLQQQQQEYPAVLESAPFPALGSLEEITQTLSRVKSNQTQKNEKSILGELDQDEQLPFKQTPYHTDGIKNPGWLTVLSCFLVNFFVFGTTFAWGNYQKLLVYIFDFYHNPITDTNTMIDT